VSRLKLLWVDMTKGRPEEPAKLIFEGYFDMPEADHRQLPVVERAAWDVICFNFDYPAMAGLKLIPLAKSRWPSVPVLMLTEQSSADLMLWALRSRVFDVLVKPIDARELERMVSRLSDVLAVRRTQGERRPQSVHAQIPTESRFREQSPAAPRLRVAIAHVAKHYLQRISEAEIARMCEMSPSRFCREFKAAFGVTFVEYVAVQRMLQAKRLLANPSMPVGDVAMAVGFNDPSYFTRVFRKQEGLSPSEYRASVSPGLQTRVSA
jgi:AraC-like DNA-binding protein